MTKRVSNPDFPQHKKHRFAARKKIEKKYVTKVAEIVRITEARLVELDKAR